MANGNDPFGARATLQTPSGEVIYYRLAALKEQGIVDVDRLPFTIRILLENALRQSDGGVAGRAPCIPAPTLGSASPPAWERSLLTPPGRGRG